MKSTRALASLAATLVLAFPPGIHAQAAFSVDVNLVVLPVTVADRQGRPVRDLPEKDFHVFENGTPQTITLFRHEDAPVAVGLVVDNSGSMRRKLPDVAAAAEQFAKSCNPRDQTFLVNFNEQVSMGLPPGKPFVSEPEELRKAILDITARGETALYDALFAALEHVRQSSLQTKFLIVISDGGDNASRHKLPELIAAIQKSQVVIYTVGLFDQLDTDRNPRVLKRLAHESGGEAFFPEKTAQVTSVLQSIAQDIRNQYLIGYTPSDTTPDRTYRQIHVTVTAPHSSTWTARTRSGYVPTP